MQGTVSGEISPGGGMSPPRSTEVPGGRTNTNLWYITKYTTHVLKFLFLEKIFLEIY